MLTGTFGCGKTLVGRTLLEKLSGDKYKIAFVANPKLDYIELLIAISQELGGGRDLPQKKSDLVTTFVLNGLKVILEDNARDGRETVVVVDEAHLLTESSALEGLRLLLNFQWNDRFLLTLLLLGQPELREVVSQFKPLEQRIGIRCHLDHLSEEETNQYIQFRLRTAGREEPLFTAGAIRTIHQHTGGIPRRINTLCDICLLAGFMKKEKQVEQRIVQEEIEDTTRNLS